MTAGRKRNPTVRVADTDGDDHANDASAASRRGAFFGRRKGHRLRAQQAHLIETLLPRLALDLTAPPPADLRSLFEPQVDAVHLEIGFGGAENLIARAEASPRIGFIGCEPFLNGMAKALAAIDAKALSNIRLHFGDATEVLGWLPAGVIAGVELLYPDPWPKRRHWKRRFVQPSRIAALARLVAPSGHFRFATDIPHYAAWTLARMLNSPAFEWTAEKVDDWRKPWAGFAGTRYEAKAIRAGRTPCYLTFRRRAATDK